MTGSSAPLLKEIRWPKAQKTTFSSVAGKLLRDHLFSMTLTYCHSPIISAGSSWLFVKLAGKKECRRADSNRLPLLQLRVITQALQRLAQECKSRIFKGFSFLCLAQRCTVLRSRWCQSGVTNTLASTFAFVHPILIGGYRTTQSTSHPWP
jgi:hypothetical protein